MPAWLLAILESILPQLLQGIIGGLGSHSLADTPEIKAKIAAHQEALDALSKKV